MSHSGALSGEDIRRLMTDRSDKAQMEVVEKITEHYASEGDTSFSPEQVAIANDIFRLLLTRGSMTVRAMLAMQLSQTNRLPPDLARQMAGDVDEVAGPVLQYSESLTDTDLIAIIGSMVDDRKLESVARRDNVSETVSDMLVGTSIETVVNSLIRNEGAHITDQSFEKIAQRFHENAEVMDSLFRRSSVPPAAIEKAMEQLSQNMRQHLEEKYGNLLKIKESRKAQDQSLEAAFARMKDFVPANDELKRLLKELAVRDALRPFYALCLCDMPLFETTLSQSLHIPAGNIRILLKDEQGFRTIYDRTGFPQELSQAMTFALQAIRLLGEEKQQGDSVSVQAIRRMSEMFGRQNIPGMEHLCAVMRHIAQ